MPSRRRRQEHLIYVLPSPSWRKIPLHLQQDRYGYKLSEDWIETGHRVRTPYGERLEWSLPLGFMPLVVHLKDANKVKAKKRWSQCM